LIKIIALFGLIAVCWIFAVN